MTENKTNNNPVILTEEQAPQETIQNLSNNKGDD